MNQEVTDYIQKLPLWQQAIMNRLREIIHKADSNVEEKIKWGTPAFVHDGMYAWMFAATDWVHFSFPQGVLLDVPDGTFEEGEDTASKAKRTLKFREGDEINESLLAVLVNQAVANNINGKKIVFEKEPKKPVILPDEIVAELKSAGLEDEYKSRPYYQQKGYLQWITDAKREETREKRIRTMLTELEDGTYMPPKNG